MRIHFYCEYSCSDKQLNIECNIGDYYNLRFMQTRKKKDILSKTIKKKRSFCNSAHITV